MIVPFQMVMFPLSKIVNMLKLNTPWGLIIVYLGFGAGLSVFMFTGFVKSIPLEIEEAAMIDGCTPIHTFLIVVLPDLLKTYLCHCGHSPDHVDLERLPAALLKPGHEAV